MIVFKTIFPNGKIYVSQTTKERHENYFGSGILAYRAIIKFGKQNLKKEILKICNNQKQLDAWERIFIKQLDATNPLIGYNIEHGGKGVGKMSEITKAKFRRPHSEETKKKIGELGKGKKRSAKTKKRISLALMGTKRRLGKFLSEESKKKISDSIKLYYENKKQAA
jgi:group I intron endonuclease